MRTNDDFSKVDGSRDQQKRRLDTVFRAQNLYSENEKKKLPLEN